MQRENKWQERFEKKFTFIDNFMSDGIETLKGSPYEVKNFIAKEIKRAVAEERERTLKVLEDWRNSHTFNALTPQMKANKPYLKWLDEIINLIK